MPTLVPLARLREQVERYRADADVLRSYGASQAEAVERAADLLEDALERLATEILTPTEAAREASMEPDTMRRKIGRDLPNAGRKGRPRVRRCDLHGEPSGPRLVDGGNTPDPASEGAEIAAERAG